MSKNLVFNLFPNSFTLHIWDTSYSNTCRTNTLYHIKQKLYHTYICDTISRFMLIIFKYMTTCNIHKHVTVCVGLKKGHDNIFTMYISRPTNLAILAQFCKVRLHHVKFSAFLNLLKLTCCLQLHNKFYSVNSLCVRS